MAQKISLKEYEKSWMHHADVLHRLKWNLPKEHDREKLDNSINEIKQIIKTAKADLKLKRRKK